MKERARSNWLLGLIRGFFTDMGISVQEFLPQNEYSSDRVRAVNPAMPLNNISSLVGDMGSRWLCFNYSTSYDNNITNLITSLQDIADQENIYKPQFMVFVHDDPEEVENPEEVVSRFQEIACAELYDEEEAFLDHIREFDEELRDSREPVAIFAQGKEESATG